VDAGELPGDEALRLLARFGDDPRAEVVAAVTRALDGVRIKFVTADLERPFASYVRRTLAPAWQRFGETPKPGESAPVTLTRPQLMYWLAVHGQDASMLEPEAGRREGALSGQGHPRDRRGGRQGARPRERLPERSRGGGGRGHALPEPDVIRRRRGNRELGSALRGGGDQIGGLGAHEV